MPVDKDLGQRVDCFKKYRASEQSAKGFVFVLVKLLRDVCSNDTSQRIASNH